MKNPKQVKEWSFCPTRQMGDAFGYTIELIQAQKDGTEKREIIPLLDLAYGEAENIGKAICDDLLGAKTVDLDTKADAKRRIKHFQWNIEYHDKEIQKLKDQIVEQDKILSSSLCLAEEIRGKHKSRSPGGLAFD